MHAVERPMTKRSGLSIYLAAASLLLAMLLLPAAARAQWTSSNGNTTTTDNVGIGTTAPTAKLDVQAPPTTTPLVLFRQGSSAGEAVQLGVFNAPGSSGSTVFNVVRLMAGTNGVSSAGSFIEFQPINTNGSGWASGLSVKAGGKIGIGTTSPTFDLSFGGNAGRVIWMERNTAANTAGNNLVVQAGGATVGATDKSGGDLVLGGGAGTGGGGSNITFVTGTPGASGTSDNAVTEKMRITGAGLVGIGTASPQNPLTIARSGSAPYTSRPASELLQLIDRTDNTPQILFGTAYNGMMLRYTGTGGTAANQRLGVVTGGAGEAFVVNNDGNVGIGTTSPQHNLDVSGSMAVGAGYTSSTTAPANGLIVQGGVGIGTSAPNTQQYMLDVNGSINVNGNINAKYQDVAEWVPSTQKLTAGTVVVLDAQRANHVLASASAYDTAVAGVVSARPGISLGEGGEGKVLVATTGRVKVRVDATRAPIRVGDLLVTSEAEGVAMKSVPVDLGGVKIHRPGTIIGKALEPLEKGTGEILVLLSLQ